MYAQLESKEVTSMAIIRYVLQPCNMYIIYILFAYQPFKHLFVFVMNKIALKYAVNIDQLLKHC